MPSNRELGDKLADERVVGRDKAATIEEQAAEIEELRAKLEESKGDKIMRLPRPEGSTGDLIRLGDHPERPDTVSMSKADHQAALARRARMLGQSGELPQNMALEALAARKINELEAAGPTAADVLERAVDDAR